ncbi:Lipase A, partial [Metarhizium brunneum]
MDSPFDEGFTSYVIQFDQQKLGNFLGRYGILWFVSMLSKGWVVCSPDYEGPDGLFVNGIMSGRATLDGIRAVLRSKRSTGVEKDAKVALWGYSGGSLATEFALELQGSYAPDLDKNIIVAASGGLPVDAAGVIKRLSGKLGAGLAMSGILGISKSTPQLRQYFLDSFVSKGKRDEFLPFEKSLAIPTVLRNLYRDVFGYFKDGEKFFEADVVQAVLRENKMGSYGTPKVPYYVYHAIKDEVLPEADAKALIQSHCHNGAKIKYVRESFGEHVIVGLTGAAGAAKFLIDHMDGRGTQSGCDVESVVSSLLNPAAAASLTDIVFNEILAILRLPL